MARPAKPVALLRQTNDTSRRTKRELAVRDRGEKALLTGQPLRASDEVRANPDALREFRRIKKMLGAIGKDDSLYSAQISRYCLLAAEAAALAARKAKLEEVADAAEDAKDVIELYKLINSCDRELMSKRKMMMDIEKENVMTIASALRSIPKKPDKAKNPLMEALSG